MARVCGALKRANSAGPAGSTARQLHRSDCRGDVRTHRIVPSAKQIEEQIFSISSILSRKEDTVKSSAFTAHTANASDGTALPDGTASRAVGATLNAARPTRAMGSVFLRRRPARVEPHLVAIKHPRSAYGSLKHLEPSYILATAACTGRASAALRHSLRRIFFTDRSHGWAADFGRTIIAYSNSFGGFEAPKLRR